MKPAEFTFHRPTTLADAIALLARLGDAAKPIAGGQSLVPMMNLRIARPEHLVDLNAIRDLEAISATATTVEIGAMARHHALATSPVVARGCPVLAEVAATIGHYAIRQRGTLGGSLAHADPAAQLPLAAIALGATIEARGPRGARSIEAGEFFQALMTTALAADELIDRVRFPRTPADERAAYAQFSRRHGDFALAAALVATRVSGGRIERLQVTVGGATAVPVRLDDLAATFLGAPADERTAVEIATRAAAAIEPDEHPRIEPAFRREVIAAVVERALRRVLAPDAARAAA